MPNKWLHIIFLSLFCLVTSFAQTESDSLDIEVQSRPIKTNDSITPNRIDPLTPAKAAFFSAVLPGLGQAFNRKYWKIPIVIGAIGAGIVIYDHNNKELDRYRDAYKRRLAGFNDDEFYGSDADGNPLSSPRISEDGLIRAQQNFRRNREISLLVTIGLYALNIIDANVDAHLLQYNVDENLSLKPHIRYNELENSSDLGLTLNLKF